MSIVQTDYILRMVQMMGEIIIAALRLKRSGVFVEADKTLSDALLTLIPNHADLIEMVDERTAAALLGDQRLIEAYCELLLERSEVKIVLGAEAEAEALQRRALKVFLVHAAHEPELSPNGHLLFGRMTGLELELLLDRSELEQWKFLGRTGDH